MSRIAGALPFLRNSLPLSGNERPFAELIHLFRITHMKNLPGTIMAGGLWCDRLREFFAYASPPFAAPTFQRRSRGI